MVTHGRFASSCAKSNADGYLLCLSRLYLPLDFSDGSAVVYTCDTSQENLVWLRAAYPGARLAATSRRDLLGEFERRFGKAIADDAVNLLARSTPSLSARTVATRTQLVVITTVLLSSLLAVALNPNAAIEWLAALASLSFIGGTLFRAMLAWLGGTQSEIANAWADEDHSLPLYTVLVPLYREANVLPRLVQSLRELDYPKDKLDIKLIVEFDDLETISAAEAIGSTEPFQVIRVPSGLPRTKPRACNYAFAFARGEFTVIYDAEDRPEHDQLRKAVAKFRAQPRTLSCLQARLNFYNANENWLTRLFALDYGLWFDALMPGLERLRLPMPLGGTSNHFRTSALRAVGAWDPFNVTEDADIGVRLAQMGMRVSMLDSTTFEEAPPELRSWTKQRSRWMKGYAQTWLVHMRDPGSLRRRTGWRGFASLQLFIGGTVLSALINPILWLLFVASCVTGAPGERHLAQHALTSISGLGLISGNLIQTWLAVIAPRRRGWNHLAPYGFTVTLYWTLISVAAWRGVLQLFTRPFHWEKTAHGMSRFDRETP